MPRDCDDALRGLQVLREAHADVRVTLVPLAANPVRSRDPGAVAPLAHAEALLEESVGGFRLHPLKVVSRQPRLEQLSSGTRPRRTVARGERLGAIPLARPEHPAAAGGGDPARVAAADVDEDRGG